MTRALLLRLMIAAAAVPPAVSMPVRAAAQETAPLERARALYDAGRLDEARALLRPLADAGTGDAEVFLLLGAVERAAGWPGAAVAAFRRARALDPASARAGVELASALAADGRLDEAVRLYREVLAREPGDPGARVGLAFALAWRGRLDEAGTMFTALAAERPDDVSAWIGLGFVERARYRRAEAEAAYRRALALDPGNADALAALDRLPWDRRGQARVLAGPASLPGAGERTEVRVDAQYALTPALTVAGAYQRYAFGAVTPVLGGGFVPGARVEHSVEATTVYRASPGLVLGGTLSTFFSEDSRRGVLWLEAVARVAGGVSLVANLRPALSDTEPERLLAGALGVAAALPNRQEVTVRALVARDTEYEPRVTWLASYDAYLSRRVRARAQGAHVEDDRFGFTSVSAGATFLLSPSLGITADAMRRTGTAERSTLLAGFVLRL